MNIYKSLKIIFKKDNLRLIRLKYNFLKFFFIKNETLFELTSGHSHQYINK